MNLGEFSNGKAQQPLLPSLASHEAKLSYFEVLCRALSIELLRLFAVGLKVGVSVYPSYTTPDNLQIDPMKGGEHWFSSRHDPSKGPTGSILRLLHYPSLATEYSDVNTAMDIRAGAHSDYGGCLIVKLRMMI